jgi:glycolate oxidase iron-sulfur subunit
MGAAAPAPATRRRSLTDDCVHCGFCLPACPTWHSWSEEMDSPRGRIDLMRGLAEGKLAWTDSVARHFDRCLGCLGCVTACPSGVRYDVLIEQTRAARERARPRSAADRALRSALFAVLPYPRRLRAMAALAAVYRRSGLRALARGSGAVRLLPRSSRRGSLRPASPGRASRW